jgi:cell division protein FtsQ
MEKKFENLRLFYEKGLPQVGWNTYREIDISYEDQIVGRRTEQ